MSEYYYPRTESAAEAEAKLLRAQSADLRRQLHEAEERVDSLRAQCEGALSQLTAKDAALRLAEEFLLAAERLINDDPIHGPGAPDIRGLGEVRTALAVIRKAVSDE